MLFDLVRILISNVIFTCHVSIVLFGCLNVFPTVCYPPIQVVNSESKSLKGRVLVRVGFALKMYGGSYIVTDCTFLMQSP